MAALAIAAPAIAAVVACLTVAACQPDRPARPALGAERGDCRADKTCEIGLICLSNLCVRPPAASCAEVGEAIASIELGNYAEPGTRAPVVARYKARCEAEMVTVEEQRCLDKTRDRWSAAACVPRLFPDLASTTTGDCAPILAKLRAAMAQQAAHLSDSTMKTWFDRTIGVVQASCEQDHWPDGLKKCLLASDGMAAVTQACNQQMPPGLQQTLQDRMTKAMQDPATDAAADGGSAAAR